MGIPTAQAGPMAEIQVTNAGHHVWGLVQSKANMAGVAATAPGSITQLPSHKARPQMGTKVNGFVSQVAATAAATLHRIATAKTAAISI
jgi:hypothetical protein